MASEEERVRHCRAAASQAFHQSIIEIVADERLWYLCALMLGLLREAMEEDESGLLAFSCEGGEVVGQHR